MGCDISKGCFKEINNTKQNSSILDRVISQASSHDQCLLYKFANYKKGGELIDAYTSGGQAKVEQLIKERFGQLMYQNGNGQIINRAEYLRWIFSDCEQVTLPIEASLNHNDPLAKWADHEACWQMQYRGSLGETLVHVLIICDTKIHTRLARTLIKCFPKLAIDVIEGEEYLGASALHLAIAYDNSELVQDLVEAGANVNQRAIGSFFLPRDQQRAKPARHTDYEGLAYLGEYPLAWSACCANESVYNLLLDNGANPDYQDTYGNMVLHMVVVCDKLDMFGYALRHPKLPASNGITNSSGLTPLTLACKLGRAEVFREMLELSAKEFWRYSNITCSAYTLNALDTILPDGRTNWNSALFIILNGTKEEHLDMLDGGIIQRLLEEKWKAFARNQFLKRLLILLVHLLLLSSAVYLRPEDSDEPLLQWQDDFQLFVRYSCEIGTVLGVLSYVILQQGDEIKNQGFWTFLKHQSNSPAKAIFLVSNLLILACIPYRILGDRETEEAILAFAVPGSWFLLMFFAGAVRLTGPFVTMIYSMITGDMLTFGIIYTIVLFGFSQSFYFLYKGFPNTQNTLYHNYPSTWMALFQITMGSYDYGELAKIAYPKLSKSVFAIFMVFVPILLLNMLIAMMGNTYAHVIEQSEKEWMKQWAKIVVTLERAISQSDAKNYLDEYSISLGASEDPSTEQRGVMVIKTKSKTRAKQRKGAVANWKRLGKVTINALKKKGLTGEELRCIMWGRESINTPVRNRNPKSTIRGSQVPNITEAFGETVSAALDLTSFAHNIQFRKTDEICEAIIREHQDKPKEKDNGVKETQFETAASQQFASTLPSTPSEKSNVFDQLTDKITPKEDDPGKKQFSPFEFKPVALTEFYDDPLRELVLNSRSQEAEEKTLNTLAIQAANLSNVNELALLESNKQNETNNLINLFSFSPSQPPPQTEKTLVELYLNKSYDHIEKPLLGSISRSLRSKSVYCRKMCNKIRSEESSYKYVRKSLEDAISESSQQELDYIERQIRQVNGHCKQNEEGPIESGFLPDGHKQNIIRENVSAVLEKIPEIQSEQSVDPLEAWSVKEITNMSKILSCKKDITTTLDK